MPRALESLRILGAIARAALRLGLRERRASLPELISTLRRHAGPSRLDPRLTVRLLEPLLPLLPPYGSGRCVKRSLLLIDLWSRAGLEPRFHLGLRGEAGARAGHAWVTTRNEEIGTYHPADVTEAFRA